MSLTEAGVKGLQARLRALRVEALAHTPSEKAEQLVRQWLERPRDPGADPEWDHARALAQDVVLASPSLLGLTAFDRLAKAMKGRTADDLRVVTLLRQACPRLLRCSASGCEDLLSGARVSLAGTNPAGLVFGAFAELDDARLIAVGPIVPLDEDALAIARSFVRPGRGIGNPVNCRAMVYRHVVRSGLGRPPPFDPEHNPIDRLAAAWAALGRDPNVDEQVRARSLAGVETLLVALVSIGIAKDHDLPALATAYRWMAAVMVETLALRGANGSRRNELDTVAMELNARIGRGDCPPETRTLFETLRAGVRRSGGGTADTDLDKLVQRIQALRAKTVEQGCTEQEALAAAEKVAELLDRYGLSLSELDLRNQACEGIGVDTGRKRRGPIDDCLGTIARFFDCRVWGETNEDGTLRYVFFGMPADVQASVYLHDLVTLAFATETAAFQAGPIYARTASGDRRNATTSFQSGLARGINLKLETLRKNREKASTAGTGRALVPVKEAVIDAELERLGLNLRRRSAARRYVQRDAYSAGQEAGEKFEYRPGIEGRHAGS